MATIGFLGLGAMGLPMAKRLCAAGHAVKALIHRNPAPAKELEELGATSSASAAEVVAGVDFACVILPEDPQIIEVLLDPGVMRAMDRRTIVLEMSSATSAVIRRVADAYAAQGVRVLDAPVSGGVSGAANGTLTIMCGGDAAVMEEARPILEVFGKKILLVGGMGAGKDMKSVNQIMGAANTVIVAEGLELARRLGLDMEKVVDIVSTSSGQSYSFDVRFRRMFEENFAGGFKLSLMKKDMRIALAQAEGLPMPMTSLAYQLYQMADAADGDLDFSVVTRIFEKDKG